MSVSIKVDVKMDLKPDTKPDTKLDINYNAVETKNETKTEKLKNSPNFKPDEKPTVAGLDGNGSSHKYGIPSGLFTEKTLTAEEKTINVKLCDPDGRVWDYHVSNKAPIYESVCRPFTEAANLNIRVS